MVKSISILGSTGSVGRQALDVVSNLGIKVIALGAKNNIDILEKQIRIFRPPFAAVFDSDAAQALRKRLSDTPIKVFEGIEGMCTIASVEEADLILNSIIGMMGLLPTLSSIKAKKNVALANKEALVVGGELIMKQAIQNDVLIIPVDSEHSAIFQCLQGCHDLSQLKRLILTSSGGPFFGKKRSELKNVTVSQALKHPNWSMGPKITIDSATSMNKGLEIIEATRLFNIPEDKIDVLIHRESIVHSMIEYQDNCIIAQMGEPDMRMPIQYALTYPERVKSTVPSLNLSHYGSLSFYEPDDETFGHMKICRKAISSGGIFPAVVNAANEEAVKLFLNGNIRFTDIEDIILDAMSSFSSSNATSLEEILEADRLSREFVIKKFRI